MKKVKTWQVGAVAAALLLAVPSIALAAGNGNGAWLGTFQGADAQTAAVETSQDAQPAANGQGNGAGANYVDADGDGVCDNYGTGAGCGQGNGYGNGRGHHGGGHHGWR